MSAPKIFISYSHDSPEHENRVLEFADKLKKTGIDCSIDQYNTAPPSGWPLWMEEQITAADYVLMVCTEIYNKRIHRKDRPSKGLGVCWEANLIYNLLYEEKLENDKFIPILFDQLDKKYIPLPLRGYSFYAVDTKKGYEDLYRRLTNQPEILEPDLGSVIELPPRQRCTSFLDFPEHTEATSEMPSTCVHNLPLFNLSHHFGRVEFLTQIHDIFNTDNTAALTQTITGLGGVGKTQIALAYAYIYKKSYRYIWMVRAENPTTCDLDYKDFALRMGLCKIAADRQEIIAKIRDWQEQNGDWLFIYDNVMEYAELQDYLPRFPKGHMLFTTRNHYFEIGNPLPVDVFSSEAAGEFLRIRTKQDELESSLALGRELGGLPLALEQAAAYIGKNHLTLQAYFDLFRKYKLRLFSNTQPPTNYNYTVATTWQISLEKISEEATRQILYFSAFLDPDRISKQLFRDGAEALPQPLAEAVADEIVFNKILTELDTYSLIRRNDDELWSIHGLLQEVVRESLDQDRVGWAESVMELLYRVYDFDYYQPKTWEKAGQLIPHIQIVVKFAIFLQIENKRSGWLFAGAGAYLYYQGWYKEAESLYKRALAIYERVLGPDHPETGSVVNNLALLYENQGRYEEVEPLYKRVLEIVERVNGPNHPIMATSLNNLAGLYFRQGRYQEAEILFKWALTIKEQMLGQDHPDTAASLNNLAGLYYRQGRYDEAELFFNRALKICERVLGPDHPNTAGSMNNLALLYKRQGRYEEAELLIKQALEIREQVLRPDHPDTASSMNNLALLNKSQGRYEEVEAIYKRTLEIRERVLGPEHLDTATSLNNLAILYYSQGRYKEAEPLYKRVLAFKEQVLGPDHPDIASSLNNLAIFYYDQGRYEEAEPLYKRALEIYERVLGPDHPDTATFLNNLAFLYKGQGRYEEVEPLFKRVLMFQEQILGLDHPDTALSLNNLACLYTSQGQYEKAEPLLKRVLKIYERVLGPDHPDTAVSLDNLALLYYSQGRYEEVEPLYKRALEIFIKVFGKEHPETQICIKSLVMFYESQNRTATAQELMKEFSK